MSAPIVLDARLDSAAADALAERLGTLQGQDVILDGSGVTLFGAKALQTLIVAVRAWSDAGQALSVQNLSPEAAAQIADLGLDDISLVTGAAP